MPPSKLVQFRLRGALLEELDRVAEAEGKGRNQVARDFVSRALQDTDRLEVLHRVGEVEARIERLRQNLIEALAIALRNLTRASDDEVRKVVGPLREQ